MYNNYNNCQNKYKNNNAEINYVNKRIYAILY